MFMMDIQSDPKGLSIGGLVVINKSMSLTAKSFFFMPNVRKYLRLLALGICFSNICVLCDGVKWQKKNILCCKLEGTVFF